MAESKPLNSRPLSPHLQIYKFTLTMAMSIVHRATGIALYAGTVLLVWWLIALASGPAAYGTFQAVAGSIFGRLVLFGYTWALLHHLLGGVKHFFWDVGAAFSPEGRERITQLTLIGSIVLTLLLWIVAYAVR